MLILGSLNTYKQGEKLMSNSSLPGFKQSFMDVDGIRLSVHICGQGAPLLLLHGFPQTHAAWRKIAPDFSQHFTCVVPDLPGYGESGIPPSVPDHRLYSKRHIAKNMVGLMQKLGYAVFSVLGHDRGARVTYRMALDHPERIHRIGIIEVIPTADMWARFNAQMAMKAYHWTFLAQPYPLPENMIAADPIAYLDWTLKSWTKGNSLEAIDPVSLKSYRKQFREPERIHAMCEDYRAGAAIDCQLDEEDRAKGHKIAAPLFFIWANNGFPAQTGDPLGLWRNWADQVEGQAIDCGHFAPEENPQAILKYLIPFFKKG